MKTVKQSKTSSVLSKKAVQVGASRLWISVNSFIRLWDNEGLK